VLTIMRDLLAREYRDPRAADAVALFCHQTREWIGSFAAAPGGRDTLVFAGDTGEGAPQLRMRRRHGLRFLGIEVSQGCL
jgi:acetate kinase